MAAIALIVGTLSSPNEGAGTSKLQKASLGRDKKQKNRRKLSENCARFGILEQILQKYSMITP